MENNTIITASGQKIIIELDPSVRVPSEMVFGGTLEGWKDMAVKVVAIPAVPHWRLALLAGPVGCIVDYLGLLNCGLNFSGETSIGKTTAQMLGASWWFMPLPRAGSLFYSANTTVNNFELMAARSNGSILVIDELALKTGKDLQELIFRFSGGRSKGRMTKEITARREFEWRTFALLSSEQAIETKIRDDRNAAYTAGTAVRILDIGLDGHIARLPKPMVDEVRAGAAGNFGHAGVAFARELLRHDETTVREALAELTRGIVEAWEARLDATGANTVLGTVARAAEVFGLIRLAGEIAVKIGLLPAAIDVAGTVDWAFDTYMATGGRGSDAARQAIEALEAFIAAEWNVTVVHGQTAVMPMRSVAARCDDHAIYVPHDKLAKWCGSTLSGAAIAAELSRRNLLFVPKLEKGKKFTRRGLTKGTFYPLRRSHFGVV